MIYISNFNNSRNLSDIKYMFDHYQYTNIDILLDGFANGQTEWSVPKNAMPGDTIVFMCAVEARHNLGMATSQIPSNYSNTFRAFVTQQKALYKQYSGCLLGYGIVASIPSYNAVDDWWMADIKPLTQFINPIHIDDFRTFISISTRGAITYLSDDQWNRLQWLVNQKNPGLFPNVTPPDAETLRHEFEEAVKKAESKPLSQLKKTAEKKGSKPAVSTVQTKVYQRDSVIAAYVKKSANGHCQLCGMKAPFIDQNGEPYLECHHINWLSKGGMDSVDNCVALCPNCHRKMHMLNLAVDVAKLMQIAASRQ